MAEIKDYKVPDNALDNKKVQSLSNYPSRDGVSATELKKFFDWPEIFIERYYNPLVELLQSGALKSMGIEPYKDITATNLTDFLKELADKRVVFKTEDAQFIKVQSDGTIPYLMVSQNGTDWKRIGHPNDDVMLKSDYVTGNESVKVSETSKNSEKLGGQLPSYYETKSDGDLTRTVILELTRQMNQVSSDLLNKLGKTEKAADSEKLGGVPADQYATKDDIQTSGGGDMLSSKYDSNKDGVVNKADVATTAESVEWIGVKNKPNLVTNETLEQQLNDMSNLMDFGLKQKLDKTNHFDCLAELQGNRKTTTFKANGRIEEEIVEKETGMKLADRLTIFINDKTIHSIVKMYNETEDVVNKIITKTTFKDNGEIEEAVS